MFPFRLLIEILLREYFAGDGRETSLRFVWLVPGKRVRVLVEPSWDGSQAVPLETPLVTADDTCSILAELLDRCRAETATIESGLVRGDAACIRVDEWPFSFVVEPLDDGYAIMILPSRTGTNGDCATPLA